MRCDSSELARHGIGAGPAEREEMLSLLHDPWTWVRLPAHLLSISTAT